MNSATDFYSSAHMTESHDYGIYLQVYGGHLENIKKKKRLLLFIPLVFAMLIQIGQVTSN